MDVDDRKIKILEAIINDYIITAEPVGSRTIAKKYDLGISSATIRNEMADLEDMGYLEQLHTSSGRKPSDKGYRLYVDKLMIVERLTLEEEMKIKSHILSMAIYEIDKLLKGTTHMLSELTNLTCILNTPSVKKSQLKSVQLISIDNNSILVVIITYTGIIKNNILKACNVPSQDNLHKISNVLNEKFKNLPIEKMGSQVMKDIKVDLKGYEDIINGVIPILIDALTDEEYSQVYLEGATNIFNYPEYNDIDKAKEFLSLLDNKGYMQELLDTTNKLTIKIGEENYLKQAKDCSVISAVYSVGNKPIGTIGLIGPTRIPYSKIVSIMSKVMKGLNDSLKKLEEES
ncbi:heat-inducible transcriptional repressor HrcA [Clostridium algidicarnis]|uniref:Heat-inducible transcription repressor HrcA n=1 Tax=Clostridium algidicarnis TaxID=37659 RepID=A0ABS6BZC6_9CLOT|nr:heat-inducible transcriptional repressor HrcA [Clostridium algidicarnis]MBB6630492.1 heat-inducible transcriptional repressor HrcA [Clostridium algidicarnis]MBU3218593.1 heat-inducible transcriptional repressor HrcA [Clostridium algidicarnis]MCB2286502.1 heat-inducible transcriptional repressor HrcA [Clostridium algidicarnis]